MKAKLLILLISIMFCFSINEIMAQPSPPGSHGTSSNEAPAGGGAPIAGGIGILVSLGVVYGARKWIITKKEVQE